MNEERNVIANKIDNRSSRKMSAENSHSPSPSSSSPLSSSYGSASLSAAMSEPAESNDATTPKAIIDLTIFPDYRKSNSINGKAISYRQEDNYGDYDDDDRDSLASALNEYNGIFYGIY
jgi:hypothetical protein